MRNKKLYCNVPGVYFLGYNKYGDVEVRYEKFKYELLITLDDQCDIYCKYCEYCKDHGIEMNKFDFFKYDHIEDNLDFAKYVEEHPYWVYEALEKEIERGMY